MKRILVILALMMAGYPLLAQDDTVTSAQKSMDEIQTDAVRREHDQPVDNTTRTKKTATTDQTATSTDQKSGTVTDQKNGTWIDQQAMTNDPNGMNRSKSYEGYRSPYFNFSNVGNPKDVQKLGTDPEFPFLQHKASATQVYQAIKRNADKDDHQMSEFNNILIAIGFANGAKDVQQANVTSANIPSGTLGNMGDGTYASSYSKLDVGGDDGVKAWKVTGTSGYVYFLAACGNAFYPQGGKGGTACVTTPVNVTATPVEITAKGQQNEVTDKVFVYYHMRRHHKHPKFANSAIADANPSKLLLLTTTVKTDVVPETYKVTVNDPDQNITVCPDSAAVVSANINVEKISGYAGYNPATPQDQYKMVSRRSYMRADRKMRKAERKEEKVARITKTEVSVDEKVPM